MDMPPMKLLQPQERERLAKLREQGRQVRALETCIVRGDGSELPVDVWMGHADVDGGRAIGVVLRDRSQRVEIEAALRESEERFRSLAESCPDAITLYAENKLVYANPVALELLGLDASDLGAFDPWTALAPESIPVVERRIADLSRGENTGPMEIRLRRPSGQEAIVEVSTTTSTVYRGKPAIASYVRDVTARRAMQDRLIQQDRLAAVGTLVAGLAHELNNPSRTSTSRRASSARCSTPKARRAAPRRAKCCVRSKRARRG
jgi:PAS domain S-box-containing protein